MLCRLLLMRHAKSSWPEGMADHERPLDAKGIDDTPKVAKKIKSLGYEPELVLCSDSKRTLETWSLVAKILGNQAIFESTAALYNSGTDSYLKVMREQDFPGHTLLVVGHNPVIEELIFHLSAKSREMKPAFVAVLEIHSDSWEKALSEHGVWKLVNIISC